MSIASPYNTTADKTTTIDKNTTTATTITKSTTTTLSFSLSSALFTTVTSEASDQDDDGDEYKYQSCNNNHHLLLSTQPSGTQPSGTKFRYIIHGVPKSKKYTVEEAKWCDTKQHFVNEHLHTVSSQTLKQWLGYIPKTMGTIQTTMWMFFPSNVYRENETRSPLLMWEHNNNVFIPYSFEQIRFFPEGNCHEQASQIPFRFF